ncbi:MAG: hypothetical protein ABI821_00490 [Pseudomonadota bacterium]
MPATKLALLFFLQLAGILAVSRGCGWAVKRWLRQPHFRSQAPTAAAVSVSGILVPFAVASRSAPGC